MNGQLARRHPQETQEMQFGQPERRADGFAAIDASVDERAAFIMKTYLHLVGAVFAFVFLEVAIFASGIDELFVGLLFGAGDGRFAWLIVLGLFIGAGWVANRWAMNSTSPMMAYAGLGLYVFVEAIVFIPLLYMAVNFADATVLPSAALETLVLFGGLTGVVFLTRKDFSFLKGILGVAALGAMGVIVASLIFGFSLGVLFSGAMVVLAGGYTLYYTSNVLHHYRTDQHVAAALALFSAIALMFYYVLRIFMSRR